MAGSARVVLEFHLTGGDSRTFRVLGMGGNKTKEVLYPGGRELDRCEYLWLRRANRGREG